MSFYIVVHHTRMLISPGLRIRVDRIRPLRIIRIQPLKINLILPSFIFSLTLNCLNHNN